MTSPDQEQTARPAEPAAQIPPRPERLARLRAMMGEPDHSVVQMTVGIRRNTARHYEQHVLPLVRRHWPEVLDLPFGTKLRLTACDLYASAPYTVLFCAPNRPLAIRLVTGAANRLALPNLLLGYGSRAAMEVLGRVTLAGEHRRIILVAAFIATIDHVLDHCMTDAPAERGRKLHGILDRTYEPDTPELKLTRALRVAMADHLASWERAPFEGAMTKLKAWVDAEVAGMTGVVDPTGKGHRVAGVEGTIDGLLFPVHRYAGEGARRWMYDVSMFIQMMDDYLDLEKDIDEGRHTPVMTGEWTFDGIAAMWRKTVTGIEALTRAGGLTAPHYVGFVRNAYVLMLCEVLEGMASGIAD
ncbi:MAG: hypothetical protein JRI68_04640 [Deltaproteobacteria bacterium]|nr:hypothetical protein [Deltaproteobacteria bacterium]